MTLRLLAEVLWQPVAVAAAWGAWRSLGRESSGPERILGTAVVAVAVAWLPVAAVDLAARTRHDASLPPRAVDDAGAVGTRGLIRTVRRLRAVVPAGDTYHLDAYSVRVSEWASTALLPRVAVGADGADWEITWRRRGGAEGPPGATKVARGVWVAHRLR